MTGWLSEAQGRDRITKSPSKQPSDSQSHGSCLALSVPSAPWSQWSDPPVVRNVVCCLDIIPEIQTAQDEGAVSRDG